MCMQWRGKSTYVGAIAADQVGLRDSPPLLAGQARAHLKLSKVIIFPVRLHSKLAGEVYLILHFQLPVA